MAPVDQNPELTSLRERVCADQHAAEKFHKPHRDFWAYLYSLYRNCNDFKTALRGAKGKARADVREDGKRKLGAELFIPYVFWTVETVAPRLLSNDPKVNILPRGEKVRPENVEGMKFLIDAQQERMRFGLKLRPVSKAGLKYGLGVGKTYWRTDTRTIRRTASGMYNGLIEQTVEETLWDDPDFAVVDPWDFFWDPFGEDIESCEFVIHRTWRSMKYVRRMVEQGVWDQITVDDLSLIESSGAQSNFEDAFKERRMASVPEARKGSEIHEVWEWHDGEKRITVLDSETVVQVADNYGHHEIPFQIYRPTILEHEFVGIGEIEPIEHLQQEMNTLRSQRRDNATYALNPALAYAEGIVDKDALRFGPGITIPVPGDPRELLFPIQLPEVPGSSYREADEIRADIERTSGLSDSIVGREARGDTTATEVQLVQSAANIRIQEKTKLIELGPCESVGNQMIALDQEKIASEKSVRVVEPGPGMMGAPRWRWVTLTPQELAGSMEAVAVGGATAPENVPQMRQDAQIWERQLQNPFLDPQMVAREMLRNMGIRDPDSFLRPTPIPQPFLEYLAGKGVPPALIGEALQALHAEPAAAEPSSNGSTPKEPVAA
jgi:hypothetical protein